uniref:Uncharacterized protein n=1 Tax=Vespula pensylvanica TaxID=30213 RepID=A0A834PFN3_VESPE|nr:hypothetical protein H0235_001224 [Vespula pensylvanica]
MNLAIRIRLRRILSYLSRLFAPQPRKLALRFPPSPPSKKGNDFLRHRMPEHRCFFQGSLKEDKRLIKKQHRNTAVELASIKRATENGVPSLLSRGVGGGVEQEGCLTREKRKRNRELGVVAAAAAAAAVATTTATALTTALFNKRECGPRSREEAEGKTLFTKLSDYPTDRADRH